jgi:hypothetical protein
MNIEGENPAISNPTAPMSSRRRWRGLSLRALMLIILAVGGVLGWWLYKARVQREVVAAIKRNGGSVTYDWDWGDNQPLPPGAAKPWPKWLVQAVGPDFLGNVKAVHLLNRGESIDILMADIGQLGQLESLQLGWCDVSDDALVHLRNLTRLRTFHLSGTRVRGPGLIHLKRMTQLEDLSFHRIPISDDDLSHLAGLTRLKHVSITVENVTTAGLVHLRKMRGLETLDVWQTKITSLEPIRNLTHIKSLGLTDTPIDDAGLEAVANFRELESLYLQRVDKVTDAGLASISGLPKLASLSLNTSRITDAGLDRLHNLPSLSMLDLGQTAVTDAGVARFVDQGGLRRCMWLDLSGTQTSLAGAHTLQAKFPSMLVQAKDGSGLTTPITPVK